MRLVAVWLLLVVTSACRGSDVFRQYEYEEDVYVSLDGTATVYVNGSVPALDALRGATFDPAPNARVDRNAVRDYFTTPVTQVTRPVATSLRNNRRFVHVRVEAAHVDRLGEAAPFAWSSYRFGEEGGRFVYRQVIGPSAGRDVGRVRWTGQELVAFRLHLPSTIVEHNAGEANHKRGNILVWEQSLADRLQGKPLYLVAQMETESILARTLRLFGVALAAVLAAFGCVIWWIARRGKVEGVGG
jgi:hypothetical protein